MRASFRDLQCDVEEVSVQYRFITERSCRVVLYVQDEKLVTRRVFCQSRFGEDDI